MGATLAARAGFEERELVRVKRSHIQSESTQDDKTKVRAVELWVAIRRPTGSPISNESATSLETQL
jgi:hypothetical protein